MKQAAAEKREQAQVYLPPITIGGSVEAGAELIGNQPNCNLPPITIGGSVEAETSLGEAGQPGPTFRRSPSAAPLKRAAVSAFLPTENSLPPITIGGSVEAILAALQATSLPILPPITIGGSVEASGDDAAQENALMTFRRSPSAAPLKQRVVRAD